MESAREARRRRILERGSDRLAFITGQSQSLPDPPSPSPAPPPNLEYNPIAHDSSSGLQSSSQQKSKETLESTTYSTSENGGSDMPKVSRSDEIVAHEKDGTTLMHRFRNEAEIQTEKVYKGSEQVDTSKVPRSSNEYVDRTTSPISEEKQESVPLLTTRRSSDQVESFIAPKRDIQDFFSAKRINHAISASENIRVVCAIAIAILVVLANRSYILGSAVASVINFRPIFLVLLTDLTIILGLLMGTQEAAGRGKERVRTVNDEYGLVNNLGKTLELSMVLHKVLNALFMDCSICAVIMICGFGI